MVGDAAGRYSEETGFYTDWGCLYSRAAKFQRYYRFIVVYLVMLHHKIVISNTAPRVAPFRQVPLTLCHHYARFRLGQITLRRSAQ